MSTQVPKYQLSGRWSPVGLAMPLVVMAVITAIGGIVYSAFIHWNPYVYISFIATFFYCFGIGWLTSKLVKIGKTRHRQMAFVSGFACGCVALYLAWVAHVFMLIGEVLIVPTQLLDYVIQLSEFGSWGIGDEPLTGVLLILVWLIEAGFFLVLPGLTVYAEISDTPFCEEKDVWLEEREIIDTVALFNDEELAAIADGDLAALVHAQPRSAKDLAWMRLTLKYSEHSQETHTLSLAVVHLQQNKDGQLEEHVTELSDDLLLDQEAFAVIKGFAAWTITPGTDRKTKITEAMDSTENE